MQWLDVTPVLWFVLWNNEPDAEVVFGEYECPDSAEAVAWAVARAAGVVIHGRDDVYYWAGSQPRPDEVSHLWQEAPEEAR